MSRRCSLAYAGNQEVSKFDEVEAKANEIRKPKLPKPSHLNFAKYIRT